MSLDTFSKELLEKFGDNVDIDTIVAAIVAAEEERIDTIKRALDNLSADRNPLLISIDPIVEHEDLLARRYSDVYQPIRSYASDTLDPALDFEFKHPKIREINKREYNLKGKENVYMDPIQKVSCNFPVDYHKDVESDGMYTGISMLDDAFIQRLVEAGLLPSDSQSTEKHMQKGMNYTFGGKDKI